MGKLRRLIIGIVTIAIIWTGISLLLGPKRLPGLDKIAITFANSLHYHPIIAVQGGGTGSIIPHVLATFLNTIAGLFVGITAALLVVILCANNKLLLDILDTLTELIRVVPPLLFIPFLLLLVGFSNIVAIVSIAIYAFFASAVYLLGELKNVSPNHVGLGRMLGANNWQSFTKIKIPSMLPKLIGPFRIIAALGLGIGVVSEYMAVSHGIGRVMKFAISYSGIDLIIVGVIWAIVIVSVIDIVVTCTLKLFLKWTEEFDSNRIHDQQI